MSGLEIIGLVLGVLPLLLAGAQTFEKSIEKARFFFAFRSKFADILSDVKSIVLNHNDNFELLDLILKSYPSTRVQIPSQTAASDAWQDLMLKKALEGVLGRSRVEELLEKFSNQWGIIRDVLDLLEKGKDLASKSEKFQMKIAISFSKKRRDVVQLKTLNKDIGKILSRQLKILQAGQLRSASLEPSPELNSVMTTIGLQQSRARHLLSWFRDAPWDCPCITSHPCNITASCHRDDSRLRGAYIELLLGERGALKRVEVVLQERPDQSRLTQRSDAGPFERTFDVVIELEDAGHGESSRASARAPRPRHPARTTLLALPSRIDCSLFANPEATLHPVCQTTTRLSVPALGEKCRPVYDGDFVCLEQFYKEKLYIDQRLQLGLDLAYCILGLGGTSGIPQGWGYQDVWVVSDVPAVPFYRHKSARAELGLDINDVVLQSQIAVFSLGVILLQLIFQKRPEDHESWGAHLVHSEEDHDTLWNTAMVWKEAAVGYGFDVESAVHHCVELSFDGSIDLEKPDFVRRFLELVVVPLERAVRRLRVARMQTV